MGVQTNFLDSNGQDIGAPLVDKSYLIDRYPELANTFKQAGLWLWGFNPSGELGTNDRTYRSSPVQTVAAGTNWRLVEAGGYNGSGIKTDGTLWIWGQNTSGQIGDNTMVSKSSPVQTVAGGTNWKQVSGGLNHNASIKTDGTLWLWGRNNYGQLGTNNTTNYSSPVQTVSGGTNWKLVNCGANCTAAIKIDGTLWLWGRNSDGQLGDNTIANKSSPIQTVSGLSNWQQVACGIGGGGHTAAIKTDGTLWLWGNNGNGQLGINTFTPLKTSSPVQTVSGGTNWKQVSCGSNYTAAIKTDGSLWLWGNNGSKLGDNTTSNRSSPVQTIAVGTNWKQVSCGSNHTAAIKTDGSLWIWGQNTNGQLGDNTLSSSSSPVQTVAAGTNWKQISVGSDYSAAIRDDSDDYL